jgi:hypothetical protein
VQEEEQLPAIYMFLAGLKDTVEEGPLALANHMNLYAWEAFIEFSWEYLLDKAFGIWKDPPWVPNTDPALLPDYVLPSFPIELRNAAVTYARWLRQAMEGPPN